MNEFQMKDVFLKAVSRAWRSEDLSAEERKAVLDHQEWVKANRLETVFGSCMEEWKDNYLQNWGRVKTHLQVFAPLSQAADRMGLTWVGVRGPFASLAETDDPAMHYFADLDVLVAEEELEASLTLFQEHGFEFRSHDFPKSFYRKHHLNYSLVHGATGVLVDLHWAVDHPYTHLSVDYDDLFSQAEKREQHGMIWWEPRVEHRYLLAALHAMKHVEGKAPANAGQAVEQGSFRFFWECAALSSRGELDEKYVCDTAASWNVVDAVEGVVALVTAQQASPSKSDDVNWRAKLAEPGFQWLDDKTCKWGFRFSRVRELGSYLWPSTLEGKPAGVLSRLKCAVEGLFRLSSAGVDYMMVLMWSRMKSVRALFLLMLLCGGAEQAFAAGTDDYPGGIESATLLAGDSNNIAGNIEIDVDRDWFCFESYPDATYQFQFDTNTIWDVAVKIHSPGGSAVVLATNTIDQAPANWGWTNNGAYGRYYIELGGLVEFTTGTYSMVMTRTGFVDSEPDGLGDGWETDNFGDLDEDGSGDNDGDGFTDEEEYWMGTEPTNAASGLFIVDLDQSTGVSEVSWPSTENGTYRLSRSEFLNGVQIWTVIQTYFETNIVALQTLPDPDPLSALSNRFYRIEFIY